MSACTGGQVVHNGQCATGAPTLIYTDLVFLALGVGAIVFGVYLRRQLKRTPPAPRRPGPDRFGEQAAVRITAKAAPYFLMLWGTGFMLAGVALMVGLISRALK
jgi:hypothetical protein